MQQEEASLTDVEDAGICTHQLFFSSLIGHKNTWLKNKDTETEIIWRKFFLLTFWTVPVQVDRVQL